MRALLTILILLAVAGCVRLEREAPVRDHYGIEARRDAEPAQHPLFAEVRVYRFDPVARFAADRFVYRYAGLRYEDDYYNRFIAPPGTLIAEETRRWLDESGLFAEVHSGPVRIEPPLIMEGRIVELYGDFSAQPSAVLAVELSLLDDGAARPEILLRRTYRSVHPLAETTSAALAQGWSRALEEVLRALEDDLKTVAPRR